jgi:hypothetical protein
MENTSIYQPASGPLYRIETRYLDDASITPSELARHATLWVDTPSTGGTAIDANGNISLSGWRVARPSPSDHLQDTTRRKAGILIRMHCSQAAGMVLDLLTLI